MNLSYIIPQAHDLGNEKIIELNLPNFFLAEENYAFTFNFYIHFTLLYTLFMQMCTIYINSICKYITVGLIIAFSKIPRVIEE